MKTYEVFLKREGKDPFTHAGSFDAPDEEMALIYARETYGRRGEGEQMWVVPRTAVLSANEKELAMADRDHKHNDGLRVAELRRISTGEES